LFWELLTPKSEYNENSRVAEEINKTYGSLENFKMEFGKAAMNRFGSGWAWLLMDKNKQLSIASTPNQDAPISEGLFPVLALDVWEHAYYLMHQNRRADYINSFWKVVNWVQVEENYKKGLESL
jgi:Fe-Mn family superoxide dismutase